MDFYVHLHPKHSVGHLHVHCCLTNLWTVAGDQQRHKNIRLNDVIEDMLITLGKQYHILRPMARKEGLFIYLVLDKAKSNLALARRKAQEVERELVV